MNYLDAGQREKERAEFNSSKRKNIGAFLSQLGHDEVRMTGKRTHAIRKNYKTKSYPIQVGNRGGQYIQVKGKKIYIRKSKSKPKPKPTEKTAKKSTQTCNCEENEVEIERLGELIQHWEKVANSI